MSKRIAVCTGWLVLAIAPIAQAQPLDLFTSLVYAGDGNSPPPDSYAVYSSTLAVAGLAAMPSDVAVRVPLSLGGEVAATLHLESMDRREGFTERDPLSCGSEHPEPGACDTVPYPDLPIEQFSYTWIGQGDGYDLRLTVHRGHAIGVFPVPATASRSNGIRSRNCAWSIFTSTTRCRRRRCSTISLPRNRSWSLSQ